MAFYVIYIEEAHPSDVWQMQSNVRQNVVFTTPKTAEDREHIAGACVRNLHIDVPALVDGIENTAEKAYTGWPDRLYIIDRAGRVAFKSKPGPFGFHPSDMEPILKRIAG